MTTKTTPVSVSDIEKAITTLDKLIVQGKAGHMRTSVQAVLGGLMLPELVKQGSLDATDPILAKTLSNYSKSAVKNRMNPQPIAVPVEVEVETVVYEKPIYRRLKTGLDKEKRKKRALDHLGRNVLIRWWNANQRLIPDGDPVCVTLTAQINALKPKEEPLSPMQIAGYFSHLCRMGLRSKADRDICFARSIKRQQFSVKPLFSQKLLEEIRDNWENERANEAAMIKDHHKLTLMRDKGIHKPIIAQY